MSNFLPSCTGNPNSDRTISSKSSFLDDKLSSLNAGADDFLSEPIDLNEFVARLNAHLRRKFEENI